MKENSSGIKNELVAEVLGQILVLRTVSEFQI